MLIQAMTFVVDGQNILVDIDDEEMMMIMIVQFIIQFFSSCKSYPVSRIISLLEERGIVIATVLVVTHPVTRVATVIAQVVMAHHVVTTNAMIIVAAKKLSTVVIVSVPVRNTAIAIALFVKIHRAITVNATMMMVVKKKLLVRPNQRQQ